MWWAGSKRIDVYLGHQTVLVWDGNQLAFDWDAANLAAVLAELRRHLGAMTFRGGIRLWLSGGICRPFLMPELPGVGSSEDLAKIAERLASEGTGLVGPCKVWLDAKKPSIGHAVGVAMEQEVLDSLRSGWAPRQRVMAIRPWWSEVLRWAVKTEPSPKALAVQDTDSLTMLLGRESGFEFASALSPVRERNSADAAWARLLLARDIAPGDSMVARLGRSATESGTASAFALAPLTEISR